MKILISLFGLMLLLGFRLAYADFYEYVDDEGKLWITDRMKAVPKKYRDQLLDKGVFKTEKISEKSRKKQLDLMEKRDKERQQFYKSQKRTNKAGSKSKKKTKKKKYKKKSKSKSQRKGSSTNKRKGSGY